MARILVFCDSIPDDPADGLHLRVQNLVKELAGRNTCFLLCGGSETDIQSARFAQHFSAIRMIPIRPRQNRSWQRHLRISNAHFLKLSSPEYFAMASATLAEQIAAWNIDLLVSFAAGLDEVCEDTCVPKILDFADSRTLTIRRQLSNPYSSLSLLDRLTGRLKLLRQIGRERSLVRRHDITTTISEVDRQALLAVSGVTPERVAVIPNGVAEQALSKMPDIKSRERSIIFWGNLDFPPNKTAVKYFHDKVFQPFLQDLNITWHIVGRSHDVALRKALESPQVVFHGFVQDLFNFARRQGVMINPMVEGSGLKNKVLEAFAIGLPVVSTTLGVEAIDGKPRTHYLDGNSPEEFASAIVSVLDSPELGKALASEARKLVETRYTWSAVGNEYAAVLDRVLTGHRDDVRARPARQA